MASASWRKLSVLAGDGGLLNAPHPDVNSTRKAVKKERRRILHLLNLFDYLAHDLLDGRGLRPGYRPIQALGVEPVEDGSPGNGEHGKDCGFIVRDADVVA